MRVVRGRIERDKRTARNTDWTLTLYGDRLNSMPCDEKIREMGSVLRAASVEAEHRERSQRAVSPAPRAPSQRGFCYAQN